MKISRDTLKRLKQIAKQAEKDAQMISPEGGYRGMTTYERCFCVAYNGTECGYLTYDEMCSHLAIGVQFGDFAQTDAARVLRCLFPNHEASPQEVPSP